MENTNPTGKSISELVKLADEQKAQLLVIGPGNDEVKQAALIAKLEGKGKLLIVSINDLNEEDRKKINEKMDEPKENPFENPPLPFTNRIIELPKIEYAPDFDNSKPFHGFKRKKLKGYQKGKR